MDVYNKLDGPEKIGIQRLSYLRQICRQTLQSYEQKKPAQIVASELLDDT